MVEPALTRSAPQETPTTEQIGIVVPHTHWDREWYAPFESMRFHLLQFLDELMDELEANPDLVFLLDGQSVILEDYLEVRRSERERVTALVTSGQMRPGPSYVQPDEFHVSGEGLVRNLLIGCRTSREFGWVMREGYLPDTFGHVHQMPQILRGFGIETFYAMRGFGYDADDVGSEFWWEGADGSRVLVHWLTESYSNAAVLTDDPDTTALHHGILVRYDSLPELLERMGKRSHTGVLLLLNGGDHLRVQPGVSGMVEKLDAGTGTDLRLAGLEEFSELVSEAPAPSHVHSGELRYGRRHDVFDGIGSTRTPMKAHNERTEAHLSGVAERLDALATLVDGRSNRDSLDYAWRQLVKNYAHDSICGCSIDEVHREMDLRFTNIRQVSDAVATDALHRIAHAAADRTAEDEIPLVVLNPSGFVRTEHVSIAVLPDLDAPLGQRRFGWKQGGSVDWSTYTLRDSSGAEVPFTVAVGAEQAVADPLDRRKELVRDLVSFEAREVPPLGTSTYRLIPKTEADSPVEGLSGGETLEAAGDTTAPAANNVLENGILRVETDTDGTVSLTSLESGYRFTGLLELIDDGDRGDEYGFGPVAEDTHISSRSTSRSITAGDDGASLQLKTLLPVPASLTPDRSRRSAVTVDLPVTVDLRLASGADRLDVSLVVDNIAKDHRLRLRMATGLHSNSVLAESAFGIVQRNAKLPDAEGWHEKPTGAFPMRRFAAVEDESAGLQVLTEGLHEYTLPAEGVLDVTVLRSVGWMARTDHPLRPHKVGPEVETPGAQCLGRQEFRIALRPYAPTASTGHLYTAAERFAVPFQGCAVQGQRPRAGRAVQAKMGLGVAPEAVVLSALKTAENGDGLIVRVFNSSDAPVTADIRPGFTVRNASACDLEEQHLSRLDLAVDGAVQVPLTGGQIATVRLTPEESNR